MAVAPLARAALVAVALVACAQACTDPGRPEARTRAPQPVVAGHHLGLPAYTSSIHRLGPRLPAGRPAGCPVAPADLRLVRVTRLGFDGRAHPGELVVHADHAADLVTVFERLYAARWPVARMRPIEEYDGDDDRSMAANNTSAYNCRTVAGTDRWSDHAYGAAVDLNPVQNPDLTTGPARPPAGRPFAHVDRSPGARTAPGVVRADDVVVRAFAAIGWEWGGDWSAPDYQHFAAADG
jgi:poly-gamma-glutamate synthesis protein (capsule biosynthesis protein)